MIEQRHNIYLKKIDREMGRPKAKPKTGGRQVGSPNKRTKQIHESLELVIAGLANTLLDYIDSVNASKFEQCNRGRIAEVRQPNDDYILIPLHTSENRNYIPFGYYPKDYIVGNSCTAVPNSTPFHFGVISSLMHMSWVKVVCGRLESRFRYSNDIVYCNFPWPENITDKQIRLISEAADHLIEVRRDFNKSSLADLYDPLSMPPNLLKAHIHLDKVVDLAYRSQPFSNEAKRIEFLFELYEKYTADLFSKVKPKKIIK